ncbi:MAG: Hsp20/alpha crystallin family protein [Nitrosopumilus sp. H13]|nr:MAG: Hsp20/alpha crystallin family protein [Nitrosopumilus sp. H13]
MSSYKGSYSSDQSTSFAIPIILIIFVAGIYVMVSRTDAGFAGIILIGAASVTMIYWTIVLKKIAKDKKPMYTKAREQETKNWVYDLIKGDGEFVFVAEVPGPEDKITVRLVEEALYIRGSSGFSKEVMIENASGMQIFDFKYRNGVLTLRIK